MTDLVEFLLARITEDEQVARDVVRGTPWWSEDTATHPMDQSDWRLCGDGKILGRIDGEYGGYFTVQHIIRWHPDRALAECEAKRRIVGLHHSQPNWTERQHNEPGPRAVFDVIFDTLECAECSGSIISDLVDWPCPTLRLLSLPYAGHPAYRDEWRP